MLALLIAAVICADLDNAAIVQEYRALIRSRVRSHEAIERVAAKHKTTVDEVEKILGKGKPKPDNGEDLFPIEGETKVQMYRKHDRFKKFTEYTTIDGFDDFEIQVEVTVDSKDKVSIRVRMNNAADSAMLADGKPCKFSSSKAINTLANAKKIEVRANGKEFILTKDSMDAFGFMKDLTESPGRRAKIDKMFESLENPDLGMPIATAIKKSR